VTNKLSWTFHLENLSTQVSKFYLFSHLTVCNLKLYLNRSIKVQQYWSDRLRGFLVQFSLSLVFLPQNLQILTLL
jgi:hypothetical protein